MTSLELTSLLTTHFFWPSDRHLKWRADGRVIRSDHHFSSDITVSRSDRHFFKWRADGRSHYVINHRLHCWNYNYKNWWALPIYWQVIRLGPVENHDQLEIGLGKIWSQAHPCWKVNKNSATLDITSFIRSKTN